MVTPLITLSQYQSLTNSATSTDDTLISSLISAATVQIENYCDRKFFKDTYIQWGTCDGYIFPKAKPILSVIYFGEYCDGITLTNNGTTPYIYQLKDDKLTIGNGLNYNEYNANTSLSTIASAITGNCTNVTAVINSEATDNGLLLYPKAYSLIASGTTILKGVKPVDGSVNIFGNKIRIYSSSDVVAYVAGYTDIPLDLQLCTTNIVRDALNIQKETIKAYKKSETITNYSYTLQDGVSWYDIIQNYQSTLDTYRNISF